MGVALKNKKTIFVAMSGGVDSSVAALLLKNKGYDVVGVFIRGFNIDGCGESDATDARRVASHLQIPFYVFDFEKEYKEKVVEYMVKTYKKGLTPNPDVMCNKEIKFGMFLKKALEMGANYVATGHYVRLAVSAQRSAYKANTLYAKRYALYAARDSAKDQSYFLWTLTQEQLRYCLFPIGDYLKSEVRKIAKKAGLATADKKDSQGICFLGKITLKDFLKQYLPTKKGAVLTTEGKKIGEHDGAWFYTIGQRHINIKFQIPKSKFQTNSKSQIQNSKNRKPYYVVEKNIKTNTLVVAEGNDNPALYKKEIKLTNVNFQNQLIHSNILENIGMKVLARTRYRQPLAPARFIIHNSRQGRGSPQAAKFIIQFDAPVKFVAPGQSTVFYLPAEVRKTKAGDKKGPAGAAYSAEVASATKVGKALAGMELLGGGIIKSAK